MRNLLVVYAPRIDRKLAEPAAAEAEAEAEAEGSDEEAADGANGGDEEDVLLAPEFSLVEDLKRFAKFDSKTPDKFRCALC
jgi:hypothetical protein